jgi:hypothetical protein
MAGRKPKLTAADLQRIDRLRKRRCGPLPVSALKRLFRVSHNTLLDAIHRRGAYTECARG